MSDRDFQKRWKDLAGRVSQEWLRNELSWELIELLAIKKSEPEHTYSHKSSA
jgi:hypothetical protein